MMTRAEAIARYSDQLAAGALECTIYAELVGNEQWKHTMLHLPIRMHGGIVRWVLFGILPGDFLRAIIRGDLFDAAGRADDENQRLLWEYAYVMHNAVPSQAKGPNALTTWKGIFPEEDPVPQAA
jgi:hypothetical protein